MTFSARSGAHDDLVLALAIAVWRAKRGIGPPLLSFYRAQLQQAKGGGEGSLGTELAGRYAASRRQVEDDAAELTKLYLDTLSGINPVEMCASCGQPLGASKISDGVNRWCPNCPPPSKL